MYKFFDIENKSKDLEIVPGDGKDLDISPVYDHIEIEKPNMDDKNKQNIVIPTNK